MNNSYPYHIDYPELIPATKESAQIALNLLDEFKPDIKSTPKDVFLKGWFAIAFLGLAPHPDDIEEWHDNLEAFAHEAFRRQEANLIEEDHVYCSDAQQQGQRLQVDGNLNSYVVGTLDGVTGYLSANFDPDKGNQPCLTGSPSKCYSYDSPADAAKSTVHLNLDSFKVYGGSSENELDCPAIKSIPLKELYDREVILQREDGQYLYRDGVTWGDSTTRACKYMLYKDNVEAQIQQVKAQFGATWKWLDYQKILDNLD